MRSFTKYIKNILLLIFSLIMILSLQSCFISKLKKKKKYVQEEKTEFNETLKSIKLNELKFKTFYSGFTGKFENSGKEFPLKGILKIKKDTFILISIRPVMGIEIAKVLLTQDSIKIIDKIKKEYIVSDYNFINKKFGYDLDFKIIQSILTNKYFEYPKKENISDYIFTSLKYKKDTVNYLSFSKITDIYRKKANNNLIFAQNKFNLVHNNFNTLDNTTVLNISYSDFNKIKNQNFPKKLEIKLSENGIKNNIFISYKNIRLNNELNFKISIPDDYKFIKFE